MQTLVYSTPCVSYGNKKLPKSTAIFNLPAGSTCPMRTEFCARFCYAKKAERIYPQVSPSRERNLALSRQAEFVGIMVEFIGKNQSKIKAFRIHESGDFYSQ